MKTRKILISALLSGIVLTSIVSCGDDDSGSSLPPIGGYNSADEVGADNLIAYWPLNGNGNESKSGTASNDSEGVTFSSTDAIKGEAATFNAGYLSYPSISALSSTLTSFSISSWIKLQNNGASSSIILSLTRPNEWAGNVNFMAETGWMPSTSDSLTVKGLIVSNNALGWQDSRNATKVSAEDAALGHVAYPNKIGGQWAHAVITWDGATRLFKVYVNGVKISNPVWELRGADDSPALEFSTPTHPVIGALLTYVDGTSGDAWNAPLTGKLDEIRVWNKALVQADINSLYELELAGR